jgi:hypothetical protein
VFPRRSIRSWRLHRRRPFWTAYAMERLVNLGLIKGLTPRSGHADCGERVYL